MEQVKLNETTDVRDAKYPVLEGPKETKVSAELRHFPCPCGISGVHMLLHVKHIRIHIYTSGGLCRFAVQRQKKTI